MLSKGMLSYAPPFITLEWANGHCPTLDGWLPDRSRGSKWSYSRYGQNRYRPTQDTGAWLVSITLGANLKNSAGQYVDCSAKDYTITRINPGIERAARHEYRAGSEKDAADSSAWWKAVGSWISTRRLVYSSMVISALTTSLLMTSPAWEAHICIMLNYP